MPSTHDELAASRTIPTLPCENLAEDLYLNPDMRAKMTVIAPPGADPVHLVPAEDYMAIQKERDENRRVLALINAWRRTPYRSEDAFAALLARVGQDDGLADATRSIMMSVPNAMRLGRTDER